MSTYNWVETVDGSWRLVLPRGLTVTLALSTDRWSIKIGSNSYRYAFPSCDLASAKVQAIELVRRYLKDIEASL